MHSNANQHCTQFQLRFSDNDSRVLNQEAGILIGCVKAAGAVSWAARLCVDRKNKSACAWGSKVDLKGDAGNNVIRVIRVIRLIRVIWVIDGKGGD